MSWQPFRRVMTLIILMKNVSFRSSIFIAPGTFAFLDNFMDQDFGWSVSRPSKTFQKLCFCRYFPWDEQSLFVATSRTIELCTRQGFFLGAFQGWKQVSPAVLPMFHDPNEM